MKRLFISDLDGTLLRSDGQLSAFAREGLERLIGAGVPFTVASARSVFSIRDALGDLPLALPLIESDGAHISDYRTGEHLVSIGLDAAAAARIHEMSASHDCAAIAAVTVGGRDQLLFEGLRNGGAQWFYERRAAVGDPRLRRVESLAEGLGGGVTSLIFIGRLAAVEALRREVGAAFDGLVATELAENPYSPGWFWLRVMDVRATKGTAVRALAERLGVALADVVVFGDAANDLSMFRVAGHSVATANADADVIAEAQEVIGPCDEDSVVRWLLARV